MHVKNTRKPMLLFLETKKRIHVHIKKHFAFDIQTELNVNAKLVVGIDRM